MQTSGIDEARMQAPNMRREVYKNPNKFRVVYELCHKYPERWHARANVFCEHAVDKFHAVRGCR